jgi:hypothetical protein
MTTTLYSDAIISPRTTVYAERQMLKHAMPHIVLDKFGLQKQMPKNKSQTIKFRRPRTFSANTAPLTEGVTPAAVPFGYDDVSVSLKQYGMLVSITDVIEDTHEDPVLNDATLQVGENIGRTREALTYGVLSGRHLGLLCQRCLARCRQHQGLHVQGARGHPLPAGQQGRHDHADPRAVAGLPDPGGRGLVHRGDPHRRRAGHP